MTLNDTLRRIDYNALPISDYNRNYILHLLPRLDYHLEIYQRAIRRILRSVGKPASKTILVDYGGGHGFFSLAAKMCGVGQVIYIDINPQSVATAQAVAGQAGFRADVYLSGDSDSLRRWCLDNGIRPDALVGMDVIEHIYRLNNFFADLFAINPTLRMLFTTGSNPDNPLVARRLHRIMQEDELGYAGQVGFRQMRREHLAQVLEVPEKKLDFWAAETRGLVFDDLRSAVESGSNPNLPDDPYNTCDPRTGSWTERILPIGAYRALLSQPHGATLHVRNGRYNTHRSGIKGLLSLPLNLLLHMPCLRCLAPYIVLEINL